MSFDQDPNESVTLSGADFAKMKDLASVVPDLLREAQLLRCLASSPRFQDMTVADAFAELANNGMQHDGGAAIVKATWGEGKSDSDDPPKQQAQALQKVWGRLS